MAQVISQSDNCAIPVRGADDLEFDVTCFSCASIDLTVLCSATYMPALT